MHLAWCASGGPQQQAVSATHARQYRCLPTLQKTTKKSECPFEQYSCGSRLPADRRSTIYGRYGLPIDEDI